MAAKPLVLPRPGTKHPERDPIPAPAESEFTATFGALLPAARYLTTPHGKAAYYVFPVASTTTTTTTSSSTTTTTTTTTTAASSKPPPPRVLLIHGVQTPALGLLPLASALRSRFPGTQIALLDLWGHGLSETPVEAHEGGLFAGLVEEVVQALGWGGDGLAIVGYSFGSVVGMEWLVRYAGELHSLSLVAPAGLLKRGWFGDEERGWLSGQCADGDEGRAAEFVVRTLEGGPLIVPGDWQERVAKGEVVAQAVKEWQMRCHAGHKASVVGVFRDGGVFENQELFRRARETGVDALVVLGELDDLSTEEEIKELGFETRVVAGAGHAVVRERAEEVAERIGEFWRGV